MKSYRWQKEVAWLSTVAAVGMVGLSMMATGGGLKRFMVGVAFGMAITSWVTVLDHKHGIDPKVDEIGGKQNG